MEIRADGPPICGGQPGRTCQAGAPKALTDGRAVSASDRWVVCRKCRRRIFRWSASQRLASASVPVVWPAGSWIVQWTSRSPASQRSSLGITTFMWSIES